MCCTVNLPPEEYSIPGRLLGNGLYLSSRLYSQSCLSPRSGEPATGLGFPGDGNVIGRGEIDTLTLQGMRHR